MTSVHSLYLQNRLAGAALGGPSVHGGALTGGGFFGNIGRALGGLGRNFLSKAKAVAASAAPILQDAAQNAGRNALNAVLSSDGSVKDRLRAGLAAGAGSVDRGDLQQRLLAAARPVF
eukprot:m.314598 g.314598  ORF g.314598 m.314598 type:complete len:118 (+) comp23063_c0_seq12:868-1221(+)